jgi:hypothetical protein
MKEGPGLKPCAPSQKAKTLTFSAACEAVSLSKTDLFKTFGSPALIPEKQKARDNSRSPSGMTTEKQKQKQRQ